jgi:hypothetical protein
MPMGKGTYGSKRGRPKKKTGLSKLSTAARKKAGMKASAGAKSRYDKIIYGNTRRKKK